MLGERVDGRRLSGTLSLKRGLKATKSPSGLGTLLHAEKGKRLSCQVLSARR